MKKPIYLILALVLIFLTNSAISQVQTFDDTNIDYKVHKEINLNLWDFVAKEKNRQRFMWFIFDCEKQMDWQSIETEIDFEPKKEKEILLKLGRQEFYNNQLKGDMKEDYASHFHLVDIDNDKDLDIIYNASDGADAELIIVWVNSEYGYERIMRQGGEIKSIIFENNGIVLLVNNPCYSDYTYGKFQKIKVAHKQTEIIEEYKYFAGTIFPSDFYKIYNFKTINEKYNLRTSPVIKNEPCDEYPDGNIFCGNIYLELAKGSSGKSISAYQDETGRIWWFSIIKRDENNYELGWISSRFIEIKK